MSPILRYERVAIAAAAIFLLIGAQDGDHDQSWIDDSVRAGMPCEGPEFQGQAEVVSFVPIVFRVTRADQSVVKHPKFWNPDVISKRGNNVRKRLPITRLGDGASEVVVPFLGCEVDLCVDGIIEIQRSIASQEVLVTAKRCSDSTVTLRHNEQQRTVVLECSTRNDAG